MEQAPKTGLAPSNTPSPELDFAIVLARVIEAVKQDPAELRNAVYDLARIKLHQQAWQNNPPIDLLEMRRLSAALETAIDRVEAISSKQDQLKALKSLHRLIGDLNANGDPSDTPASYPLIEVRHDAAADDALTTSAAPTNRTATPASHIHATAIVPFVRRAIAPALVFAAIAGLALTFILIKMDGVGSRLFAVNGGAQSSVEKPNLLKTGAIREVDIKPAPASLAKEMPSVPRPAAYGIYALSGNRLFELEPLPGRVPDQRVFMSAIITKPSHTTIPDGRISFLAYRRDFANAAPSRVSIRVIAKITRAMSVTDGKVENRSVDDAWAIRNIDVDLKVSPFDGKPEMLLLRGDTPDFTLSPGRYALVLNNVGYDFSIAGQVTDKAHCLERTVAANGIFYSECRAP